MKLGGNRPPGDNPLLFAISGTGSFICPVALARLDIPRPLITQSRSTGGKAEMPQQDEDAPPKRVSIRNEKAIEEEKRRLKAQRSAACGQVTGKPNQIKILLEDISNVQEVRQGFQEWEQAYDNFQAIDSKYNSKLDVKEGQQDYAQWVTPRLQEFDSFRRQVEFWLRKNAHEGAQAQPAVQEEAQPDVDVEATDSVSFILTFSNRC